METRPRSTSTFRHHMGKARNIEYNYSRLVFEFEKRDSENFNAIKMEIRNMSTILRDQYLDVNKDLMNEALE